ncbi:CysZ protein [Stackebrandtia albiflava]|uniref:CysZ protein n=1 Tax=Stackebrandtia albiflava TaxID=406432 RepID=A0A562UYR3_9ACTN|nr:EI24 domain-containing protein [Stackebrandtia albiflava]TWJ10745.1 CysZ protein [Stackebrandtia albiflava]
MRDIGAGIGYLVKGFGFWGRRPGVMLLGAIPALLAGALLLAAFVALAWNIADLTAWLTGFSAGWPTGLADAIQIAAGVIVFAIAGWLSVILFTAITLTIGDPFYEAINRRVETYYGGCHEVEQSVWQGVKQSIVDGLRLLAVSLPLSVLLFLIGLIPVVGTIVALVLGGLVGGWFLAVEVTSYPFNRRGIRYRQYRAMLAKRRPMAVGFGVGIFLLFLIPLGAVLVMPAAVAGGTLLARDVLGEPVTVPARPHPAVAPGHR